MRNTVKVRWTILVLATCGTWLSPAGAWASRKNTPFGELDDSCVTNVPRGGRVDLGKGEMDVDGKKVGVAARCSEHVPACQSAGGWYAWTWANARNISGMNSYDYLSTSWTVPANPTPPIGDAPLEYFFPSLEAQSGGKSVAIIQPVMSWGYTAQEWEISSWGLFNCDAQCRCQAFKQGPVSGVYAGDLVDGSINLVGGSPDGWDIYIRDETSGAWADLEVANIPNSWPKFTTAQSAVNENYGFNSCADLPPGGSITFNNIWIFQAGPTWDSFNDVRNSTSWAANANPKGLFPGCHWGATGSTAYGMLNWSLR
ncbi:MAG: hypothetical protein M3O46_04870 [Myxococcota bacterium]|nr:hypothetical protein [Myxococcota bacterium]